MSTCHMSSACITFHELLLLVSVPRIRPTWRAWMVTGTQEGGVWRAWTVTWIHSAWRAWRVTGTQEGGVWRAWTITGTQEGSHTGPRARRKCLKGDRAGQRFPEPQRVDLLPGGPTGSGVLDLSTRPS